MSLHAVLELDAIQVGGITAGTPRRRRSNDQDPDGGGACMKAVRCCVTISPYHPITDFSAISGVEAERS